MIRLRWLIWISPSQLSTISTWEIFTRPPGSNSNSVIRFACFITPQNSGTCERKRGVVRGRPYFMLWRWGWGWGWFCAGWRTGTYSPAQCGICFARVFACTDNVTIFVLFASDIEVVHMKETRGLRGPRLIVTRLPVCGCALERVLNFHLDWRSYPHSWSVIQTWRSAGEILTECICKSRSFHPDLAPEAFILKGEGSGMRRLHLYT